MTQTGGFDLEETTAFLTRRITHLLHEQEESKIKRRIIIALAGVPGSGKSTISSIVLAALSKRGVRDAAIVPMDGFHFTKATLLSLNDPDEAFSRRGAPFTFDAAAFVKLVKTLYDMPFTDETEPAMALSAPSFDHALGDPVADSITISSACKVVLVEGNYTLLSHDPWSQIAMLVDERWFVDVPREEVRRRLVERHFAAGIEVTREAAEDRVNRNDLPNGDYIRSNLIEPDVRIIN